MAVAATNQTSSLMSGAEFRSFQERRPNHERWELIAGVPMMMTPPTIAHNRIASNLERLLNDALILHDRTRIAILRPGIELGSDDDYRPEPDVAVIDADFVKGQRFSTRAYLLAEIVSPSDEIIAVPKTREPWIDAKRRIYRAHAHCEAVLIVQQDRIEVEVDIRTGMEWRSEILTGATAELTLPAIGLTCQLSQLYNGTPVQPLKPEA